MLACKAFDAVGAASAASRWLGRGCNQFLCRLHPPALPTYLVLKYPRCGWVFRAALGCSSELHLPLLPWTSLRKYT